MSWHWQYTWNLANYAAKFYDDSDPNNPIDYLAQMVRFSVAEIQYSVDDCVTDRSGDYFTPDHTTVGEYLRSRGLDVTHYVAPFYTYEKEITGQPPAGKEGPGKDPYWLKLEKATVVEDNDWWLRCEDTGERAAFDFGADYLRYAIDIANPNYRDWLVQRLHETRGERRVIRVDEGMLGDSYEAYVKCHLCHSTICKLSRTPDELTNGQFALYDALRADGWKVVSNMAWAPDDPTKPQSQWTFPALPHLDGIAAEEYGSIFKNGTWYPFNMDIAHALANEHNKEYNKHALVFGDSNWDCDDAAPWVSDAQTYMYRMGLRPYIWCYSDEKPAPYFIYGDNLQAVDINTKNPTISPVSIDSSYSLGATDISSSIPDIENPTAYQANDVDVEEEIIAYAKDHKCLSYQQTSNVYNDIRNDGFKPEGNVVILTFYNETTDNYDEYETMLAADESIPPIKRAYYHRYQPDTSNSGYVNIIDGGTYENDFQTNVVNAAELGRCYHYWPTNFLFELLEDDSKIPLTDVMTYKASNGITYKIVLGGDPTDEDTQSVSYCESCKARTKKITVTDS